MGTPLKDVKLLWGRSGNRCAICRRELSEDKMAASDAYPLGEQAHIVAEESIGPRGESTLSLDERNRYHNLILLCPTDHTIVDKDQEHYSVERLHMLKTEHELWVRSQLGEGEVDPERLVAQQVYGALIDRATTAARFADWYNWTSWALGPEPQWKENHLEAIQQLRRTVFAAIWPGKHPELEIALQHFSLVLAKAARTFRDHGEIDGDIVRADMFYRRANSEVLYNDRHDSFMRWIKECHELVFEATKAANWLADCVRKYVNPMFYALEGRFIVAYESGFNVSDLRPEYSAEEQERLITQYNVT